MIHTETYATAINGLSLFVFELGFKDAFGTIFCSSYSRSVLYGMVVGIEIRSYQVYSPHLHVDYTETFAKRAVSILVRRFHDAFKAIVNVVHKNERKLDIEEQLSRKITIQVM